MQQIYAIAKKYLDEGRYLGFANVVAEFEELNKQQSFTKFLSLQSEHLSKMGRVRTSETYISALSNFTKFNNGDDMMFYENNLGSIGRI